MKSTRDDVRQAIESASSVSALSQQLLRLDQGFSHPHLLRYKGAKDGEDEDMEEEEDRDSEEESEEDSEEESSNDKSALN